MRLTGDTPDETPDGWTPLARGPWLEALRCRYDDDREVIVFVRRTDSGYEVRERTESCGSAPNETPMGLRETRAAARELMRKTCRDWDDWMLRRPTVGCH